MRDREEEKGYQEHTEVYLPARQMVLKDKISDALTTIIKLSYLPSSSGKSAPSVLVPALISSHSSTRPASRSTSMKSSEHVDIDRAGELGF